MARSSTDLIPCSACGRDIEADENCLVLLAVPEGRTFDDFRAMRQEGATAEQVIAAGYTLEHICDGCRPDDA